MGKPPAKLTTIGNTEILQRPLLGLFCSVRSPGNPILQLYDAARALREAGVTVISGFHTMLERDAFRLLLRGTQPIVICPAREIEQMRIPQPWREPIAQGRLVVVSPFISGERRVTAERAQQRNEVVAALAHELLIAYAELNGKTEALGVQAIREGKKVHVLPCRENMHLIANGAQPFDLDDFLARWRED